MPTARCNIFNSPAIFSPIISEMDGTPQRCVAGSWLERRWDPPPTEPTHKLSLLIFAGLSGVLFRFTFNVNMWLYPQSVRSNIFIKGSGCRLNVHTWVHTDRSLTTCRKLISVFFFFSSHCNSNAATTRAPTVVALASTCQWSWEEWMMSVTRCAIKKIISGFIRY